MTQTATETIANSDKSNVLEAYTQRSVYGYLLNDIFSGFNTARIAAWLKLTQLECASDLKTHKCC